MMFTGSKRKLIDLPKRVLQELCYRRGIRWQRKKAQLVYDLQKWVSSVSEEPSEMKLSSRTREFVIKLSILTEGS